MCVADEEGLYETGNPDVPVVPRQAPKRPPVPHSGVCMCSVCVVCVCACVELCVDVCGAVCVCGRGPWVWAWTVGVAVVMRAHV